MKHADGRIMLFPCHDSVGYYTLKGALRDGGVPIANFLNEIK